MNNNYFHKGGQRGSTSVPKTFMLLTFHNVESFLLPVSDFVSAGSSLPSYPQYLLSGEKPNMNIALRSVD